MLFSLLGKRGFSDWVNLSAIRSLLPVVGSMLDRRDALAMPLACTDRPCATTCPTWQRSHVGCIELLRAFDPPRGAIHVPSNQTVRLHRIRAGTSFRIRLR